MGGNGRETEGREGVGGGLKIVKITWSGLICFEYICDEIECDG